MKQVDPPQPCIALPLLILLLPYVPGPSPKPPDSPTKPYYHHHHQLGLLLLLTAFLQVASENYPSQRWGGEWPVRRGTRMRRGNFPVALDLTGKEASLPGPIHPHIRGGQRQWEDAGA
eukprot:768232-Hanusia_phi.AAC.4